MTTDEEILTDYEYYCKKTGNKRYMFDDEIKRSQTLLLMQKARQDEARKIFAELEKKDAEGRSAVFSMEFGISCNCDVCKNYRKIRKKFGVE